MGLPMFPRKGCAPRGPHPLTPEQAQNTLAHRLGAMVDNVRQLNTDFGIRPYRVFMTWTRWTGSERGEGDEITVKRIEILPTPRVTSMDNIALSPVNAGILQVGSLKVDEISVCFTEDMLRGRWVPEEHEDHIPEPIEFFYEVVEDGRGDNPPVRPKFRLAAGPHRNASAVEWVITLERTSQDRTRDDKSAIGTGEE